MPEDDLVIEGIKAFASACGKESVNKLSMALGALMPYAGLEKRAVSAYISGIEQGDFSPDEKYIYISGAKKHLKSLKNQHSIASIAQNVAKPDTDFSVNSKVDDEWLDRYLDAGKFVSDEQAQLVWGHILAGEFEQPGSTPPSVTRILTELTTEYAQIFANLCSLSTLIFPEDGNGVITTQTTDECYLFVPNNGNTPYLHDLGITFEVLTELELLGLIKYGVNGLQTNSFTPDKFPKLHIYYNGASFAVTKYPKDGIFIGHVVLTAAGKCIARFVQRNNVSAHLNSIKDYLSFYECQIAPRPEISIHEVSTDNGIEYRFEKLTS